MDNFDVKKFADIAFEKPEECLKLSKLTKPRFKHFLSQHYGPYIAEKFQSLLEFSNPINHELYKIQLTQILKNKTLLIQIAFDFYDAANDDKISELDLFKVFQFYA